MTFDEYKVSIHEQAPPLNLSEELKGLWWDGKGRRAGKVRPTTTLDEEWEHIVKALLD